METQRSHFSAKLAREVYEVHKSGSWKQQGYKKFEEWGKVKLRLTKSTVHKWVKIVKYFGHCPDDEIERIGPEMLHQMALRAEKERLNPGVTGHVNDATLKELRAIVKAALRKTRDRAVFGESIDPSFRGLEHAPVGEQGVVFVFGMVIQDLDFKVQAIRRDFPDCIAKQKILDRRGKEQWREVRIEFEYKSETFYKDLHDPEGADIIVCWEDNRSVEHRDGGPEVLELKSKIKRLDHNPRSR